MSFPYFRFLQAAGLVVWALLWASCDEAPGTSSLGNRPPVLSDFNYTPQAASLNGLPAAQIVGDKVRIPISLQVKAVDPDHVGIGEVSYGIYSASDASKTLVKDMLSITNNYIYTATPTLEIGKGEVGRYIIKVLAQDRDGNAGNTVIGTFTYSAQGSPPVLVSVNAPATIQRPAAGAAANKAAIVATVTDPDGLSNIQRVVLRTTSGTELLLLDDGQKNGTSGDAVAGDGQYTITVQVSSSNGLGVNTFAFQAYDRSGLSSNIITKNIEVVQ